MLQRVTWQGDLPVILRAVHLLHYRNLDAARLSITPGLTGVVGSNGQGKTNLLEGIYLALTGILNVSRIETAITLGQHEGFVGVELEREDGLTRLEVGLAPGKKLARVDGNRVRAAELSRHGAAVWIRPEDAELVHGSPAGRRAFLDALVSRMSPRYAQVLALFERTLTQRNAVLRQADTTGLDGLEDGHDCILACPRHAPRLTQEKHVLHGVDLIQKHRAGHVFGYLSLKLAPKPKL